MTSPTSSFDVATPQEMQAYYDKWAASYEEDLVKTHDYHAHFQLADIVQKHAKADDLILCVGAGTGWEAIELRKRGFHNLHGHDGSIAMLNKAKEKGIFKEYFHELLAENAKSAFETEKYDAMVTVGCFVPKCLNEHHVEDLIRTIKIGGLSVIGTREMFMTTNNSKDMPYPFELEKKLQLLVQQGRLELLDRQRHERYSDGYPGVFLVHRRLK